MANLNQVSFTSPYAADESAIAYRRKLAEMLAKEAIEPLQTNRMAGRFVVPVSPWEGAAKLAKGIGSGLAQRESEDRQRTLGETAKNDRTQALARAMQAMQGTPGGMQADASDNVTQMPGQAPNPMGAMQALAQSNDPMLQQAGMGGIIQQMMPKSPNDLIGKLDPKDFIPETWAKFVQTGDTTQLRPRVKMEMANTGDALRPYDPYNPPQQGFGVQMKPGESARLSWDQHQWANPSTYQNAQLGFEAGRLANQGAQTRFETGGGTSGPIPQSVRPQPIPQIQGAPPMGGSVMGNPVAQAPQSQTPQQPISPQAPQGPQPTPRPAAAPRAMAGPTPSADVPLIKNPSITPKERQELMLKQPQAQTAATTVMQNMERLVSKSQELHDHSGLSNITGKLNQFGWADVYPEARGARALQKTITSEVGIQALQAMRDASKTGGAVGQVTEREWPILQQQIAALDAAQSTGDYQKALKNLQAQIKSSSVNIKRAYEQTYGPLNFTSTPHVVQSPQEAGGSIDWSPEKEKRLKELQRKRDGGS